MATASGFGVVRCASALRAAGMAALVCVASVAWANPLVYQGSDIADLYAPTGSSVNFNTVTGVLTLSGGATATGFLPVAPQSENVGGVHVFRFRNVLIETGVSITVSGDVNGSNPLSIAANGDMYIGSGFSVSGAIKGRAGGGVGGDGGIGGQGGSGGSGAGGGGGATTGGDGGDGGAAFANGSPGVSGTNGTTGGGGTAGSPGDIGATGGAGDFGFGAGAGGPAGGVGGNGGTSGGGGGTGGNGGTTGGGGGSGGSGGLGDGDDGGPGVAGGGGTVGGPGSPGLAGDIGSPGNDGIFDVPVNTLDIFAGTGGSGGGGGGGGVGGGQGGGGGSARSGGGGGGGGRGALSALAAGGKGGKGGNGGNGGTGGAGGNGGKGGDGGKGGNGGGALVLSARGILDVTTNVTLDISAGTRGSGAGGANGLAGSGGTTGPNGTTGQTGGAGSTFLATGGDGGRGGDGGKGGNGGAGALGGQGGSGGNGGRGTPGMVKLHGSIIRANSLFLFAAQGPNTGLDEHKGKVTLISNMSSVALDDNNPSEVFVGYNSVLEGRTTNPEITGLSPFTADELPSPPLHPFIPQLTTGPAVEGILQDTANGDAVTYYNKTLVDAAAVVATLPPSEPVNSIKLKRLSGTDSLYEGFDQIFFVNDSALNFIQVSMQVGVTPAVLINGDGQLAAGQTWTTTVPAGAAVQLLQAPIITTQPVSALRFPTDSVQFSVVATSATPACGIEPNFCYSWFSNRTGADLPLGLFTPTITLNSIQPGVEDGDYWCVVSNDGGSVETVRATLSFHPAPQFTRYPGCSVATPICANGLVTAFPGLNTDMRVAVSLQTVGETYQWQRCNPISQDCSPASPDWTNYTNPLGSNKILPFTNVQTSDEGQYRVIATNLSGSTTSPPGTLDVLLDAFIQDDPDDLTLPAGTPGVTFTISAVGQAPIFTIWEFCPDGGNCSPSGVDWVAVDSITYPTAEGVIATSGDTQTLDLGTAANGLVGYYRCKVYNLVMPFGTFDISERASFSTNDPGIFTQPQDVAINPGATAVFNVVAVGTPTLTYQWFKDGIALSAGPTASGAVVSFNGTGDQLTITGALNDDEGDYSVLVTNGNFETLLSDTAELKVYDAPLFILQPQGAQRQVGDAVSFQVDTESDFPVTYQWFKDGLPLSNDGVRIFGATSDTLQILNINFADEADYTVEATNTIGTTTSNIAQLIVGNALQITSCTGGGPAYALSSRTLRVTTLGGNGTRTYQWKRGNVNVGGVITGSGDPFTATLPLNNISQANAGSYVCEITDSRGTYTSCTLEVSVFSRISPLEVLVNGVAALTAEPTEGDTVTLSVNPDGGLPPLNYEWRKDDGAKAVTVVGSSQSLVLSDIELDDSGEYSVFVSDSGTDNELSNSVQISVQPGLPVAGGLGVLALTALLGAAGASAMRRRK